MDIPLDMTLRDVGPYEDAVRDEISKHAERLGKTYGYIMNCRVVVESPHKHKSHGSHFNVKVELLLPQKKVVVSRDHGEEKARENISVALRDAFDAARRELDAYAERQRGEEKLHEAPLHGVVKGLAGDHGFILKPDGAEVYFHRNSLVEGEFEKLKAGAEVRFVEEAGDKGPQASTVRAIGKHHIVG